MLGAILGLAGALAVAGGALLLTSRGELPRGTRIGGVDVGGRDEAGARAAVRAASEDALGRSVVLVSAEGRDAVTGRELAARPRIARALDEAGDVGLWTRLRARVGLGGARDVPLTYDLGRRPVTELVARLEKTLGTPARDADVAVTDTDLVVTPARNGLGIDRPALVELLSALPSEVDVPVRVTAPAVATRAAEAARSDALRLLSRRRYVGIGTTVVKLEPAALRRLLVFEPAAGKLRLGLDPEGLAVRLRKLERLDRPPRDARWETDGRIARIVPAKDGRKLNLRTIETSLTTNLDSSVHRARFTRIPPALTTAEARRLDITEMVSEFTTNYPCCAPRVTNIHRAAEILDGTVIPPGGRFSLNEAMGKRTVARGFVEAPQIFAGRLSDAVGGGVSQVATTMYNAAFFAGLRLDEHQPHEFYISRYPMGREATVSWGGPELIFTNNWPAGVLIRVGVTDTSITIRFYSSKLGRRVETKTSQPCCYVAPRTYVSTNTALAPGETRVVQSAGPSGFSVSYTRKIFRRGKLIKNERYSWNYRPENAFVERGPPAPAKKPKPKKPAASSPETPAGADSSSAAPAADSAAPASG